MGSGGSFLAGVEVFMTYSLAVDDISGTQRYGT